MSRQPSPSVRPPSSPWLKRILAVLAPVLVLGIGALGVGALHHTLHQYHLKDVLEALRSLRPSRLFLAIGLTAASYLLLTGHDLLAMWHIKRPLSYPRIALTSFVSNAFSHNIGMALLSGASIRYRFYSAWGLGALEISSIIAFTGLTTWIGYFTVGGVMFLLEPMALPLGLHLPLASIQPVGLLLLILLAAYLLAGRLWPGHIKVHRWRFRLPTTRLALAQAGVAGLDWAVGGSVLYALLPVGTSLTFPAFLAMYLLAQIAGLISQVPGGLGVFETLMALTLAGHAPPAAIAASLLAFRAVYYLLPLAIAALMFLAREISNGRNALRPLLAFVRRGPAMALETAGNPSATTPTVDKPTGF